MCAHDEAASGQRAKQAVDQGKKTRAKAEQ
jgi:hypothetical protein